MVLKKFGGRKFLSFSSNRHSSGSDVLATARILSEQLKDLETKCEEQNNIYDDKTERADALEEELELLKRRLHWQTEVTARMETTLGVRDRVNGVGSGADESWVSAVEDEQGDKEPGEVEEEPQSLLTCLEEGEITLDDTTTSCSTSTSQDIVIPDPILNKALPFSSTIHNRTVSAPVYPNTSMAVSCSSSHYEDFPSSGNLPQGRARSTKILGSHNTLRSWESINTNHNSRGYVKPAPYHIPNRNKASGRHWRKSLAANWLGSRENHYGDESTSSEQGYMRASSSYSFTPEPYMEWFIPGPVRSTNFF
jgi:hypothetical protein